MFSPRIVYGLCFTPMQGFGGLRSGAYGLGFFGVGFGLRLEGKGLKAPMPWGSEV